LVSEVVSAAEVNNLGLTGTETGVFTVLLFMKKINHTVQLPATWGREFAHRVHSLVVGP